MRGAHPTLEGQHRPARAARPAASRRPLGGVSRPGCLELAADRPAGRAGRARRLARRGALGARTFHSRRCCARPAAPSGRPASSPPAPATAPSRSAGPGSRHRAWGTGANIEAKLLQLTHAFETWDCRRVELKTDALNARSRGAIEALGAHFEGIHRKHMLVRGGENRDTAWYAIFDDDWPVVRSRLETRLAAHAAG